MTDVARRPARNRADLERRQVWVYLAAIATGLLVGGAVPGLAGTFEALLWPALAALLYVTFVPVPLRRLRAAFRDVRFLVTVLTANFVVAPVLVWMLVGLLPDDPALRVGMLLVLLVPCTDWFLTFAQLSGGSVSHAIAVTPANLLLQLALLPTYLWLLAGTELSGVLEPTAILPAAAIVVVPLVVAAVSQRWLDARPHRAVTRERLAWWPVPLLALVVLLVAGSQVGEVRSSWRLLGPAMLGAVGWLVVAALLARATAGVARLPTDQARTLAFTLGTRNSFVVLPLALALPAGWELAAVVVVTQSLVELLGMVAYLRVVPRWLFPDRRPSRDPTTA